MKVAFISCWYWDDKIVETPIEPDWCLTSYQTWGSALRIEGHSSLEFCHAYLHKNLKILNESDIIVICVSPANARSFNQIEPALRKDIKIIAMDGDPNGGLDGLWPTDFNDVLKTYERANRVSMFNRDIADLFAHKKFDLDFGVHTKHIEKYTANLKKFPDKTALLFHTLRNGLGNFRSLMFLLRHNYQIIATLPFYKDSQEWLTFQSENKLGTIFDLTKIDLRPKVNDTEHTQLIAQSHLICHFVNLATAGIAIPKAAVALTPCLANSEHYFQRILFPDLACKTIEEADSLIQDENKLIESTKLAKEKAYELSLSNPQYRKLVVEKFEEVYENSGEIIA